MSEFKKNLLEHAERELRLIGFMETEFGETCLKFLEDLAEISSDNATAMKTLSAIIPDLIYKKPLSPITEEDFKIETYEKGNKTVEIERCVRYPHLYKKNGKYWDDRAIAFQKEDSTPNDRMYIYQSALSSKSEVELPYFPQETIKKI